jgi:hypothetical protein
MKTDGSVQDVDIKLLARLKLEPFADFFWDYDLKFRGNLNSIHIHALLLRNQIDADIGMSNVSSIKMYDKWVVDDDV